MIEDETDVEAGAGGDFAGAAEAVEPISLQCEMELFRHNVIATDIGSRRRKKANLSILFIIGDSPGPCQPHRRSNHGKG